MLRGFCKIWVAFIVLLLETTVADAYTIKYNLNGGVNHPDNPTSYGNDATTRVRLEPAVREGYSFLGWYIESCSSCERVYQNSSFSEFQGKGELYISTYLGNITVYARWGLIPQIPQKDERGCYLVYTPEELYGLVKISSSGCVSLLNDIVVNKNLLDENGNLSTDDFVWWPLWGFSGTFEGNGHFISGLRGENGFISSLGFEDFYKGRSVVRNLGIKDSYFSADDAVGAIVGIVESPARLYNVYAEASVHGDWRVGGLVGIINATNDGCPTGPTSGNGKIDTTQVAIIENAYSLSYVEAGDAGLIFQEGGAGGITAEMDAAILRNVYFAGKMQGEKIDCIVPRHGFTCFDYEHVFEIENAVCMESKDTSVSKAMSLSQDQFSDGTVFDILSNGENGTSWKQRVGVDSFPFVEDALKFNIQYVLNGGVNSVSNPSSYIKGNGRIILETPQKDNDTFEGWYIDEKFKTRIDTIKTENLGDWTVYAKWGSQYVLSFVMNGGYFNNSIPENKIYWSADSGARTFPSAYRTGYDLEGWFLDTLFTQKITEIPAGNAEDVIVYAKWKLHTYTVTYHLNGGVNNPDNPTTFTIIDSAISLKDPIREGAVFYNWFRGKLSPTPMTEIKGSANLHVYAEWMPEPQEPELDSNKCYLLRSREELYWFAGVVNGTLKGVGRNWDACASLQNDIVVNKNVIDDVNNGWAMQEYFIWECIGIKNPYYKGKFYGNGYSISGLLTNREQGDEKKYGPLFCNVVDPKNINNVIINDSYVQYYGAIDNFTIDGRDFEPPKSMAPNKISKEQLLVKVNGKRVCFSGLLPQKQILIMDVQGRFLYKLQTEPSMIIDLPNAGKYVIRYENETRIVTIR